MKPKTVTLICHGPITADPKAEVVWCDVWVRFRHKGKRHSYGPTLTGRADLDGEIESYQELQIKHPEHDWSEDLRELRQAAQALDAAARVAIGNDWQNGTPTLYFTDDYFNRIGAEEMVTAMMAHLGYTNIRLEWRRETDIIVGAISIPPKRLREAVV